MTRRSKRELERALEDLSGNDTESIREWVEGCLREGFDYNPVWGETDHPDEVCVLEDGKVSYYADLGDIPEWIDVDTDLPVIA